MNIINENDLIGLIDAIWTTNDKNYDDYLIEKFKKTYKSNSSNSLKERIIHSCTLVRYSNNLKI